MAFTWDKQANMTKAGRTLLALAGLSAFASKQIASMFFNTNPGMTATRASTRATMRAGAPGV